jgi:hypothetical protein
MMRLCELTAILAYEPVSGIFRWRVKRGRAAAGDVAGSVSAYGYTVIKIDGRPYFAHRLAWLWANGSFPTSDIDHINGVRTDNRPSNLRLATRSQNIANSRLSNRNSSGLKGVRCDARAKKRKWTARIVVNRKEIYLGSFTNAETAHAAYCAAARENFGSFARPQ